MEWKPFALGSIFSNRHGKRLVESKRVVGDVPLLTAGKYNQGISAFISNEAMPYAKGGFSVDMFGNSFAHPYKHSGDDNIYSFNTDGGMSLDEALFITVCISQNQTKYSYGKQFRQDNADKDKVILPIDEDGSPDWDFMASYSAEKRGGLLMRYRQYVAGRLSKLEYKGVPVLDEVEWDAFYVRDVFEKIERGKRLKKADHKSGKVPYASSTSMNNGIDGFIEVLPGTRVFENCISLANSGSVGSAFYEPFAFVASDHVTHLKTDGFSEWLYLFLATVIEQQGANFNFNREINDARIKQMQIMLPVNADGNPDYVYMEQYAKNMMKRKYEQYLDYIEK